MKGSAQTGYASPYKEDVEFHHFSFFFHDSILLFDWSQTVFVTTRAGVARGGIRKPTSYGDIPRHARSIPARLGFDRAYSMIHESAARQFWMLCRALGYFVDRSYK
jgi:hypothetical protein